MLIVSIPEDGPGETVYQSWWSVPEIRGYKPGAPEYEALQRMWGERMGKPIPKQVVKKRKLVRDKVISVVKGKELVGVYWEGTDGSEILFACSPEKADRIIGIFNEEVESDEEPGERKRKDK